MELESLIKAVASKAPAPGGGAVSCVTGSFACALASMAAKVTLDRTDFSKDANTAANLSDLAHQMDRDSDSFLHFAREDEKVSARLFAAYKQKASSEDEKHARSEQIQVTLIQATHLPLQVIALVVDDLALLENVARLVKPSILADVEVARDHLLTAFKGSNHNVENNLALIKDQASAQFLAKKQSALLDRIEKLDQALLEAIEKRKGQ
ncbi:MULTISPECIES: cyclodeaminase/cyclohydrolase family protein [Aerococcus]|uniref:Cyclodeaminase/cyclohydrolase family protein n=1 Tax=Aerococcus tenax TaxID=3078812 RepID=A0A5N1BPA9_9LACT|nr:cyclodeaminase/cyclohydrolase family protein [Aerococcus urinae]KAA9241526.1 cyclodeaminase/cyclohydrolase family protein [Aerococcus urinae]MDK6370699.1 cyclodeaminase/cyclohydrolase family protein [Aerococcus urinae]MDK6598082.1 cyclodeaminase/cyclohydrolase family protein [Aerococcus urinae]MDK7302094.1 cyclodeaminase/cyclohydrolase family protein [Aerococcus urinae]MDK7800956.1 cyclodeaminase/cyclohydrolase family protein [Aerococcus urinae]